jgi:hypothetical protein
MNMTQRSPTHVPFYSINTRGACKRYPAEAGAAQHIFTELGWDATTLAVFLATIKIDHSIARREEPMRRREVLPS